MQGAWVPSLVGELDFTPHAATKDPTCQINKKVWVTGRKTTEVVSFSSHVSRIQLTTQLITVDADLDT